MFLCKCKAILNYSLLSIRLFSEIGIYTFNVLTAIIFKNLIRSKITTAINKVSQSIVSSNPIGGHLMFILINNMSNTRYRNQQKQHTLCTVYTKDLKLFVKAL